MRVNGGCPPLPRPLSLGGRGERSELLRNIIGLENIMAEEEKKFERGTQLSIFVSDRFEDVGALIAACLIAFGVLLYIGK